MKKGYFQVPNFTKRKVVEKRPENDEDTSGTSPSPPPPPPPPPPVRYEVQLTPEVIERLRHVFDLIDADSSGKVSQHEMIVALRINEDVIQFVQNSSILRLLLMDAEFSRTFIDDPDQDGGITFDEFLNFMQANASEESVLEEIANVEAEELTRAAAEEEALLLPQMVVEGDDADAAQSLAGSSLGNLDEGSNRASSSAVLSQTLSEAIAGTDEQAVFLRVFLLVDTEKSGKIGRRELILAVKNVPQVRGYISKIAVLKSVFQRKSFMRTLSDTTDGDLLTRAAYMKLCKSEVEKMADEERIREEEKAQKDEAEAQEESYAASDTVSRTRLLPFLTKSFQITVGSFPRKS